MWVVACALALWSAALCAALGFARIDSVMTACVGKGCFVAPGMIGIRFFLQSLERRESAALQSACRASGKILRGMMTLGSFWNDLHYEDIHFRDNLQFELETDFAPLPQEKENISTQEFYFFIPSALQINPQTYSKEQFYKDRTNLIRYKTPEFSFFQLIDKTNSQSPLNRLEVYKNDSLTPQNVLKIQDELKLLGNIVRSALRVGVKALLQHIGHHGHVHVHDRMQTAVTAFCTEVATFRAVFWQIQEECISHWSGAPLQSFLYVDEFISNSVDYYFTGFLDYLRHSKAENIHGIDRYVCEIIAKEKRHRQKYFQEPQELVHSTEGAEEKILYHRSLLNKFVADALLLVIERTSWVERYGNIVAGAAAGIAMLIYVLLVFWNMPSLGVNSLSFLLFTVVLYVLKDRIKDGLKGIFHQHAVRWFSDYTTQIQSPDGEKNLGKLKEFFSFVSESDMPDEVKLIRQNEFDSDLRLFKRPESIFYYKKEMELDPMTSETMPRRHKLHNIFLFNVHLLLEKASNTIEPMISLELNTMEIVELELPKVYHINIIVKNSFMLPDLQKRVEIKRFRLVLDKNGIKRIERIGKP